MRVTLEIEVPRERESHVLRWLASIDSIHPECFSGARITSSVDFTVDISNSTKKQRKGREATPRLGRKGTSRGVSEKDLGEQRSQNTHTGNSQVKQLPDQGNLKASGSTNKKKPSKNKKKRGSRGRRRSARQKAAQNTSDSPNLQPEQNQRPDLSFSQSISDSVPGPSNSASTGILPKGYIHSFASVDTARSDSSIATDFGDVEATTTLNRKATQQTNTADHSWASDVSCGEGEDSTLAYTVPLGYRMSYGTVPQKQNP